MNMPLRAVHDFESPRLCRGMLTYTPMHGGSIYSFFRDITERKLSELALQESENRYRLLFDCAGASISVISLQGKFLTVNPFSCELSGYTYEELMDLSLDKLETRPDKLPELIGLVLQNGQNTFDAQHFRKDGSIVDISVDSRLITWGGEPAIMNIARDISERKQAEKKLRESNEFLSLTLRSARAALWSMDCITRQLYWSPEQFMMFGLEPTSEGLASYELFQNAVHPDDLKEAESSILNAMHNHIDFFKEYRIVKPSGEERWINAYGITTYGESDEPLRMSGICIDVTDRKCSENERYQLERQLLHAQKLESLGIMAGGIAHDFNNLLQSILSNMELAATKLAPKSAAHTYISTAMNSTNHAANLTSLMLDYTGKGYQKKTAINLNTLVMENAEMLKTFASSAVPIQLSLSAELPAILANRAQLQQVVMNLITNAAESIEKLPGGITLTTGTQQCNAVCLASSMLLEKPDPGLFVFIEVADNGCGMNEETIARLFDPFFTTKFAGRGLGMSAVMGITKAHRGALFVESAVGAGTNFRVLFPAYDEVPPVSADEFPVAPSKESLPAKRLFSGIALVVDDEKPVLKVAVKIASLCGFKVISAVDGIDAVTKFRDHADEIVVVLMDLTMPNMDGITAMNEICRIRPECKVILASGFNECELSSRITGQEPAGFIRKPYSMKALEEELQRVVQGEERSTTQTW